MKNVLKILLCFIAVDLFFFSSKYSFTGPLNTKEILALFGIAFIVFDWLKEKKVSVPQEFLGLLIASGLVSLMALFSFMYHNTQESAYSTYFLSMLVWLSAAYAVTRIVKAMHGRVTIDILSNYIVFTAILQGIVAVIADTNGAVDTFILRLVPNLGWVKSVDRIYGFADTASLDTGGIRFAIASILCMHLVRSKIEQKNTKIVFLYLFAFGVLCVTGNMIARTTIVGTAIGLAYLAVTLLPKGVVIQKHQLKVLGQFVLVLITVWTITSSLYQTNNNFYQRTRFAFEGFFSLVETGHWHTASNEKLGRMYVWPDNAETWLIGDGYFNNPYSDLNYFGPFTAGYYMDTDVGYLRFIYMFGLIGLALFAGFIIYAGCVCMNKFKHNKLLMLIMTMMTFVIWLKVATDCFFILAMFICAGYVRDKFVLPESTSDNCA